MIKVTLKNTFHNTSITLHAKDGWLSAAQIKKARKALCGIAGCTCSNEAGQRGDGVELDILRSGDAEIIGGWRVQYKQKHYITGDYDSAYEIALSNGIADKATITELGGFWDENR